jgi:hypothetical protein
MHGAGGQALRDDAARSRRERPAGPGLSRTVRLRIIGNGVVPRQVAAALRLLIGTATVLPGIP